MSRNPTPKGITIYPIFPRPKQKPVPLALILVPKDYAVRGNMSCSVHFRHSLERVPAKTHVVRLKIRCPSAAPEKNRIREFFLARRGLSTTMIDKIRLGI